MVHLEPFLRKQLIHDTYISIEFIKWNSTLFLLYVWNDCHHHSWVASDIIGCVADLKQWPLPSSRLNDSGQATILPSLWAKYFVEPHTSSGSFGLYSKGFWIMYPKAKINNIWELILDGSHDNLIFFKKNTHFKIWSYVFWPLEFSILLRKNIYIIRVICYLKDFILFIWCPYQLNQNLQKTKQNWTKTSF